jgi:hypothetical protein
MAEYFILQVFSNSNSKFNNGLISVGMFTYTRERPNIIQISLKDYGERENAEKKLCQI